MAIEGIFIPRHITWLWAGSVIAMLALRVRNDGVLENLCPFHLITSHFFCETFKTYCSVSS